jgi:Family of unknown function (DUF6496)
MPAKNVMKKFHKGKLHSGSKHGPVVTNPKQAKAIQLSELRDEGHDIPKKSKSARNKRLAKASM